MNERITEERISELEKRIDKLDRIIEKQDATERRMKNYEDRVHVTRSQRTRIKRAAHARVEYLLDMRKEGGVLDRESLFADKYYRGAFMRKCYVDAKRESRLGETIEETLARDFEEVIDYIGTWTPAVSFEGRIGVEGYKAYLDRRREIEG